MLWLLFWTLVGLLIGWATPQPSWAENLTDKIVTQFEKIKEAGNKDEPATDPFADDFPGSN